MAARHRRSVAVLGAACLTLLAVDVEEPTSSPEQPVDRTWCVAGPDAPGAGAPAGYALIFAEEFDGDALDRSTWCTRYIYGGGHPVQHDDPECQQRGEGTLDFLNDERQRYVDRNRRGRPLHEVKGGILTLLATKTGADERFAYESAMIRSKRLFRPSRSRSLYVTARVRLPAVRGTWPAFWLNSDRDPTGTLAWPPEIDIFEAALNQREDRETMLHMASIPGKQPPKITYTHPRFEARWKNFVAPHSLRECWVDVAVEWSDDQVCWVLDGQRVVCEAYRWLRKDGSEAPPAHLLLNLAIGGEWAGRHGIDDAAFPAPFSIAHVRVYEKKKT